MPVKHDRTEVMVTPEGHVTMQIRDINSSNVEWVGWPASGEDMMVVQYKGGGRYAYLGVPRQRAVAAAWSPSTGKYINAKIKPKYDVVKLR